MDKAPMEWVEKIFDYMAAFFKDEWSKLYSDDKRLDHAKIQWQSGITGLSKEEIKLGLHISRCMARDNIRPPNIIDFYLYSKRIKYPPPAPKKISVPVNREIAEKAIQNLKKQVRGYA